MDHVMDLAPCGYISFQDNGTVVELNNTLARLLDLSKDQVQGRSIENILTTASRIFYNTHLFPLLKLHEKAEEIFISLRSKTNGDIPVLINAKRSSEAGEYINEIVLIPIYQRKKYEDEILNAKRKAELAVRENADLLAISKSLEARTEELDKNNSKLRSMNNDLIQFSKIITHDLQETLHKVNVFADKLSIEEDNLTAAGGKTVAKMLNAARKADALINGLQDFIQVNLELERSSIKLNAIVDHAFSQASNDLQFGEAELAVGPLPEIEGNKSQFETAFYHLIANAIQYRRPDVRLKLVIEGIVLKENKYRNTKDKYQYTDHVQIKIKDNGSGFDPSLSTYVFELFKKIDPKSQQLGIGLSLVRKIIDNHGGTIESKSTPGEGSEFIIILPMENSTIKSDQ